MIQIIIFDKGQEFQSFDHNPSDPEGDVHELKKDIYSVAKSLGKIGKKELNIYGKNCDLGISKGEIVLISRKDKRKILKTGINAEDFFNLLFLMLEGIEIFDKKQNKKISWAELRAITINEHRKEKLISLSTKIETNETFERIDREIIFEFKKGENE